MKARPYNRPPGSGARIEAGGLRFGRGEGRSLRYAEVAERQQGKRSVLIEIRHWCLRVGSGDRPGLNSCHLRPMNRDSMPDYRQHERFGVHY
jgi:hypothetical protein